MSRFRSRWLALFAGTTLLALSVSMAFGGKPDANANTGQQVSTFVHGLVSDTNTEADAGQPSDHGDCVSQVAQGDDVGGDNENHGGAVSEAAQVTCGQDATAGQSTTDQGQSEADGNDSNDAEVEQADQADSGQADAKDQKDEHGGDSSND